MTRLTLALLISGLGLPACSGVEELALNPESRAVAGANNQPSVGGGGKGGGAGTSSVPGVTGGTSQGGSGQASAQGGAATALCTSNDSCQTDAAPYCRADGLCVGCLTDDHCGSEDLMCDVASGTCTASVPLEGNGGAEAVGGDGAQP